MAEDIFCFATKRPFFKKVFSLQTIVLRVITVHFERFMQEYESPDSNVPKYSFDFLQKQYSQELLQGLLDSGNLKTEFLDFIFNSHLREISLKIVPTPCKIGDIKQKIIQIGDSISRLSLMGAFNFHYLQPALAYLPNVRKLELEYSNCDDSTIKVIADNCPLLKELNVYASLVSDEGMRHLCFPKKHKLQLESLVVSRTDVKKDGVLMILKHMPCIRVIFYENLSHIISYGVCNNELHDLLNLSYIEIHHARTELESVAKLCPNIKHLFVKYIESPEQLSSCCAFKKLEEVSLSYISHKRSTLSIDPFLQACGYFITSLSLENFVLSVNVLVSSCHNLEWLELSDPIFEELPNKKATSLKFENLTSFKIYGSSLLSKEDVASPAFIINSSPKLESLSLQYCLFGALMEDVVLNCPSTLLQLDFTESLVSINFLQEVLLKHQRLQCLIIENSGLQGDEFDSLFCLTNELNHPVNILWC